MVFLIYCQCHIFQLAVQIVLLAIHLHHCQIPAFVIHLQFPMVQTSVQGEKFGFSFKLI